MSMISIFKIGMVVGLLVDIAIILASKINRKLFNLVSYIGCTFTGTPSGPAVYIVTFLHSIFGSGMLALFYACVIQLFDLELNVQTALMLGIAKTIISGCLIPLLDRMNPCVKNGSIAPMGLFASNYGTLTVAVLIVGNIVYAVIIVQMLAS